MFRHSHIEYITLRYLIKSHQLVEFIPPPPNDGTPHTTRILPCWKPFFHGRRCQGRPAAAPFAPGLLHPASVPGPNMGNAERLEGWGWGGPLRNKWELTIGYTVIYIDLHMAIQESSQNDIWNDIWNGYLVGGLDNPWTKWRLMSLGKSSISMGHGFHGYVK